MSRGVTTMKVRAMVLSGLITGLVGFGVAAVGGASSAFGQTCSGYPPVCQTSLGLSNPTPTGGSSETVSGNLGVANSGFCVNVSGVGVGCGTTDSVGGFALSFAVP